MNQEQNEKEKKILPKSWTAFHANELDLNGRK